MFLIIQDRFQRIDICVEYLLQEHLMNDGIFQQIKINAGYLKNTAIQALK